MLIADGQALISTTEDTVMFWLQIYIVVNSGLRVHVGQHVSKQPAEQVLHNYLEAVLQRYDEDGPVFPTPTEISEARSRVLRLSTTPRTASQWLSTLLVSQPSQIPPTPDEPSDSV